MRWHKIYWFWLWVCCLGGWHCTRQTDNPKPDAQLQLSVKDENGNLLTGAIVSLYDNVTAFQKSLTSSTATQAVATLSTVDGKVLFTQLTPDVHYWIRVTYKDKTRELELNNFDNTNVLENPLSKASVTHASLFLSPSTSTIIFKPGSNAPNKLPIKILLDGDTILLDSVSKTVRKNPGAYKWQAVGAKGCLWTDSVVVKKNSQLTLTLDPCKTGTVVFWSTAANSAQFPVSVVLDNGDTVGTITSSRTIAPDSNDLAKSVYKYREPNNYTWSARSTDGQCIWTGTFSLQSDNFLVFPLDPCK